MQANPQRRPVPVSTSLGHISVGPVKLSIITRTWDEDRPTTCGRCLRCTASNGACTVVIPGRVTPDDAPTAECQTLLWVIPVSSASAPLRLLPG